MKKLILISLLVLLFGCGDLKHLELEIKELHNNLTKYGDLVRGRIESDKKTIDSLNAVTINKLNM